MPFPYVASYWGGKRNYYIKTGPLGTEYAVGPKGRVRRFATYEAAAKECKKLYKYFTLVGRDEILESNKKLITANYLSMGIIVNQGKWRSQALAVICKELYDGSLECVIYPCVDAKSLDGKRDAEPFVVRFNK